MYKCFELCPFSSWTTCDGLNVWRLLWPSNSLFNHLSSEWTDCLTCMKIICKLGHISHYLFLWKGLSSLLTFWHDKRVSFYEIILSGHVIPYNQLKSAFSMLSKYEDIWSNSMCVRFHSWDKWVKSEASWQDAKFDFPFVIVVE